MLAMSQVCDFELRNFRENLTDLTVVSSNVKDLNGVTAALIRFSVRDTLFQIDTNLGFLKLEKRVGEILLYVPQKVKRLTIRHPHLGMMRDYEIPVSIESKTTYDVDLFINNEDYLRSLYNKEKESPNIIVSNESPQTIEPTKSQKKTVSIPTPHFVCGAGFNFLSVMGPTFSIGLEMDRFMLSADYTLGIEKVEGVGIYYKFKGNGDRLGEAYDYTSSRLSLRLGVNVNPDDNVQIVPQFGVSFNMISGSSIKSISDSESQCSKSNPLSLLIAANMRIKLTKTLCLYITPQYDFIVGKDAVYDVIKGADTKIKAWGEGLGIQAGLLLHF